MLTGKLKLEQNKRDCLLCRNKMLTGAFNKTKRTSWFVIPALSEILNKPRRLVCAKTRSAFKQNKTQSTSYACVESVQCSCCRHDSHCVFAVSISIEALLVIRTPICTMVVPRPAEAGNSARKAKTTRSKTNVPARQLAEFQALIAYACYDSPSIACGGLSMTDLEQARVMTNLCFGNMQDNPEIMCYVDQFLHGLNKFHGLFTTSAIDIQPGISSNAPSKMLLTMIPILHQLGREVNLYVGEGSIEKSLLIGKTVGISGSTNDVTGRTLLRVAKSVLCNCKKMTAIVTASDSPYKDGTFPSGTNWDDYAMWCLAAMKKAVAREKAVAVVMLANAVVEMAEVAEKSPTSAPPTCAVLVPCDVVAVLTEEVNVELLVVPSTRINNQSDGAPPVVATGEAGNNELLEQEPRRDGKFFTKGFIACCLWGHIPILVNDASTKSLSFTDMKVGTHHGKKTGLRKVLKKAAALPSESNTLDNRRGTKKLKRGSPKDDNNEDATTPYAGGFDDDTTAITSAVGEEDNRILKQALEYLESESLEKARQKHSMLSCLRVRDEISLWKGQVDSASRRFYHAKEGSLHADSLLEKLDAIEALLHEREQFLNCLQNEEADRQLKVIAEIAAHRAGTAAADISRHEHGSFAIAEDEPIQPTDKNNHGIVLTPVKQHCGVVSFASPTKSPAEAMLAIASQAVLVCVECSITPTTHKCRRCKRYVCDVCCSTQRGLEMVWWCAYCFDNESLSNQKTIREGNYESDSDDDDDSII